MNIRRTRAKHWIELYVHFTANALGLVDALVCFTSLGFLISDYQCEFMASDHVYKLLEKI